MVEIELLVNDKHVDTNGAESLINITYTFSDLSEPDKITDTYSKTITLPGTDNNNKIFGQAWMVNSLNVPTFNPSLRNSFVLTVNGAKFLSGYIKLNSITKTKNVIAYNVTLYGDVTNYFNILSDRTFRDGLQSSSHMTVSHVLTPEYVSNCWSTGYGLSGITYIPCNNGAYDDFDNGKELDFDGTNWTIESCKYWVGSNAYEFDSIEWQRNEFRSLKQRPAVRVNDMMFSITPSRLNDIQTSSGNMSSVDANFSDSFYDKNPYWNESVMTLPLIEFPEDSDLQDTEYQEAAFCQIHDSYRYNTVMYKCTDSDGAAYSSASDVINAAPQGNGRVIDISLGFVPVVDVFDMFDGTYIGNLDEVKPLLESDKIYYCSIKLEYLLGFAVEPKNNNSRIRALYDNIYAGQPSYSMKAAPFNFFRSDQDSLGSGWLKVVPRIVFHTSTLDYTYYPIPYWGGQNMNSSSQRYGGRGGSSQYFKGPQVFSSFGCASDPDKILISNSNLYSQDSLFTLAYQRDGRYHASLGFYAYSGNGDARDVPWCRLNKGLYSSEPVWNYTEDKFGQTLTTSTSGVQNGVSMWSVRPQMYILNFGISGSVLKSSTTNLQASLKVYKPANMVICGKYSSAWPGNANAYQRANRLLDDADQLSKGTSYSVDYDLDVYVTSVNSDPLKDSQQVANNGRSNLVDSLERVYVPNQPNNTLSNAGFKLKDFTWSGIVPSGNYLIKPENILDEDTTCLDVLTNFTKTFGLLYDKRYVRIQDSSGAWHDTTSLTIMTRNEYFQDYKVIDWSDKVDYSQEIEIEPVTFTTKWLSMKFNPMDTYYEKKYSNKYGIDYGEAKINTGYQFNSDTEELLKDTVFNNTVVTSEFNWFYSISNRQWRRNATNLPPCPAYFDKDNGEYKGVDTKFNFLFDNGLFNLSTGSCYITQDSSYMFDLDGGGKACWYSPRTLTGGHAPGVIVKEQYRRYSTFLPSDSTYGNPYSWDFMKPQENYQGITDSMYPAGCTIYERYWKRYIEEIYNVNNKKVTMWILLSPEDMLSFSFKNFISIDGTLYHVNKITDYNPAVYQPVQVEMITVQDITAYTEGVNIWGGAASYSAQELTEPELQEPEITENTSDDASSDA